MSTGGSNDGSLSDDDSSGLPGDFDDVSSCSSVDIEGWETEDIEANIQEGRKDKKRVEALVDLVTQWKDYLVTGFSKKVKKKLDSLKRKFRINTTREVVRRQTEHITNFLPTIYYAVCQSGSIYTVFTKLIARDRRAESGIAYYSFKHVAETSTCVTHVLQLRISNPGEDSGLWDITKAEWSKWKKRQSDNQADLDMEEDHLLIEQMRHLEQGVYNICATQDLPRPDDVGLYQHVHGVRKTRGNGLLLVFKTKEEVQKWRRLKKSPVPVGAEPFAPICRAYEVREHHLSETFYGIKLHKWGNAKQIEAAVSLVVDDGWKVLPIQPRTDLCIPIIDEEAEDPGLTETATRPHIPEPENFQKKQCIVLSK